MLKDVADIQKHVKEKHPLIHCITSPVAINDCANAVLAAGAQPIMAEHPGEVEWITETAKALTVSLANITDVRMASMLLSGKKAKDTGIPSLIDAVGVTCSPMRLRYAERFILECRPSVIKGNYSEIRALAGASYDSRSGADAGAADRVDGSGEAVSEEKKLAEMRALVKKYASESGAVVMATGAVDLISDGEHVAEVRNGHPWMARVTGTGCILSCLAGVFLSEADAFTAAVCSAVVWGTSGELAYEEVSAERKGLGSYHAALIDRLSLLTDDELTGRKKIEITV